MVGDPYGVKVGLSMPKKERVGPNHTSCTSLAFLINLLYGRIDGVGPWWKMDTTIVNFVMDGE